MCLQNGVWCILVLNRKLRTNCPQLVAIKKARNVRHFEIKCVSSLLLLHFFSLSDGREEEVGRQAGHISRIFSHIQESDFFPDWQPSWIFNGTWELEVTQNVQNLNSHGEAKDPHPPSPPRLLCLVCSSESDLDENILRLSLFVSVGGVRGVNSVIQLQISQKDQQVYQRSFVTQLS